MVSQEKLHKLISLLKERDSDTCMFFEQILKDLNNPKLHDDAIQRIANCFSITQYANFTNEEETLLENIIEGI